MELILIRHGETIWNKEGKVQGLTLIFKTGQRRLMSLMIGAISHLTNPID